MEEQHQKLELKDIVNNVLGESRMVLPGIQALFGFQLVAVFNASFKEIPKIDHYLHLVALLFTIVAIACLMAPASYHRQVERHEVSSSFIDYASKLICFGMIPLLLSITLDTYVVANVITHSIFCASFAASIAFIVLTSLWYVIPLAQRFALQSNKNKLLQATKAKQRLDCRPNSNMALDAGPQRSAIEP